LFGWRAAVVIRYRSDANKAFPTVSIFDFLFYLLFRAARVVGGPASEPEWGAAAATASLAATNLLALLVLLSPDAHRTVGDWSLWLTIALFLFAFGVSYLVFLRTGRWHQAIDRAKELRGLKRAFYAWSVAAYLIASTALFALALATLWS